MFLRHQMVTGEIKRSGQGDHINAIWSMKNGRLYLEVGLISDLYGGKQAYGSDLDWTFLF